MPPRFDANGHLMDIEHDGDRYAGIMPEHQQAANYPEDFTRQNCERKAMAAECPMPNCHGTSADISYGSLDMDSHMVTQRCQCCICDATWVERYEFTGISDLMQPGNDINGDGEPGIPVTYEHPHIDTGMRYSHIRPWEVKPLENGHYFIPNIKTRFDYLELRGWPHKIHAENIGNIKLIQHAPEMLSLLIDAAETFEDLVGDHENETFQSIHLLINKITSMVPDGF